MSLTGQDKNEDEALKCLTDTYEAYPAARMFAAHVLARQGQIAEARSQLETYLPSAPPDQRDEIVELLARLKR